MDGGELLDEALSQRGAGIEEDLVTRLKLCPLRPRDHVAGRQRIVEYELTELIDQNRALAAHGLADERQGIQHAVQCRGVELHELDVTQGCAGPVGQREALTAGAQRIGGVAEEAAIKLTESYGNLKIAGTRNGYFEEDSENDIVNEINNSKADILLAALGAPKQEKFIHKHSDKLKVKIAMGVGGSLDVLAGKVKRAPEFYQKAGLEWFYRLVKEPRRIIRVLRIPKFIALAFYDAKVK